MFNHVRLNGPTPGQHQCTPVCPTSLTQGYNGGEDNRGVKVAVCSICKQSVSNFEEHFQQVHGNAPLNAEPHAHWLLALIIVFIVFLILLMVVALFWIVPYYLDI